MAQILLIFAGLVAAALVADVFSFASEELWSALLGATWLWSFHSAKIIRLVMAQNISALPLWAVGTRGYVTLSIINFALLICSFGILVAIFLYYSSGIALRIIIFGFVIAVVLAIVLAFTPSKNPMIYYFVSGVLAIGAAVALLVR
jgi:hypothetical protein